MSEDLEESQFKANKNDRKGETEISLYWQEEERKKWFLSAELLNISRAELKRLCLKHCV